MKKKESVITFKADEALIDAMAGVTNRSEFIRNAILSALNSACPLCNGTGIMTNEQRKHWDEFTRIHRVHTCDDCHSVHLVCDLDNCACHEDCEDQEDETV